MRINANLLKEQGCEANVQEIYTNKVEPPANYLHPYVLIDYPSVPVSLCMSTDITVMSHFISGSRRLTIVRWAILEIEPEPADGGSHRAAIQSKLDSATYQITFDNKNDLASNTKYVIGLNASNFLGVHSDPLQNITIRTLDQYSLVVKIALTQNQEVPVGSDLPVAC